MRRTQLALVALAFATTLAVPPTFAQRDQRSETSSSVPALTALHEVIYPLWHTAWPNKDVALLRELLPQAKERVAALQKAELPGILRDRKVKWDAAVASIAADVDAYEKALAADQQQPLLDAVERLHAHYEGLVRLIRPVMRELDAYHQVLYQVYHHEWPDKKLDALRISADSQVERCTALVAAALPGRAATKKAEAAEAFGSLCAATSELRSALSAGRWEAINEAVERVHQHYQAAEKLFE